MNRVSGSDHSIEPQLRRFEVRKYDDAFGSGDFGDVARKLGQQLEPCARVGWFADQFR
jgi:hypothetical protein